jgi:hypothetical protein
MSKHPKENRLGPLGAAVTMEASQVFREINVWRRRDESTLVRYRCFLVLPENRYCVQSADFYRHPLDAKQIGELDRQYVELLLEEPPNLRTETYETLEEAILRHDQDFEESSQGES